MKDELREFSEFGTATRTFERDFGSTSLEYFVNEFWTSRQRAAHSLHEVSYRACFKPQLPRFFIERLTEERDTVYDPFSGRGTTILEAGLLGRKAVGCDVNPLSRILSEPRFHPPDLDSVAERLAGVSWNREVEVWDELLIFYHPKTLQQLTALRSVLLETERPDPVDQWIRMGATNRLTGHSPGFFSVYTLPPNQAVSIESQRKINERRKQVPPERDLVTRIMKKSRSLLGDGIPARLLESEPRFLTTNAAATPGIEDGSIDLVVTSPPFLDVIDYQRDNWLRCWFNGIDASEVKIWGFRNPADWQEGMARVFHELFRVVKPGGHVAFEVGEVRKGTLLLEDLVVPAGMEAGFEPLFVLVNEQEFTKTANCWGIDNLGKGTNTNRIVLFNKP